MRLVVGRVGRAHGVRGEVTVDVRTDDPAGRFAAGTTLHTDRDDGHTLTVAATRRHAGRMLVRFVGVDGRTAAEELRGVSLLVDAVDVPVPDDPDEFHDVQLLGLRVETTDGREVGTVADILHHAQDVLVLRSAGDPGREILIPFVREIVPVVEPTAGRIVVDPPSGLLDL